MQATERPDKLCSNIAEGRVGLTTAFILLLHHWCKIETYGVPYLSPFAGGKEPQHWDILFRFPLYSMQERPKSTNPINKIRMK